MELKIEAGSWYKPLEGEKAFCIGKDWNGEWLFEDESGEQWRVDDFGKPINNYGCEYNIISKWHEPKRIKVWVNVWKRNSDGLKQSNSFLSEEQAMDDAIGNNIVLWKLIARFSYEVTEWEGL